MNSFSISHAGGRPGGTPFAPNRTQRCVIARLACGLGLMAALTGVTGCSKPSPASAGDEPPPVVVELAPVEYSEAALPVRVPGVLSRKEEADLAFKVGGIVESVFVRTGEAVKKDQVLAQLRLDEIEAQVTQAQSGLAKSQRDLARVERLQANAVATLEDLQDARTAVDVAGAQARIAEFNRRYAVISAPADGHILRRLVEPNELVAPGRAILGFAADDAGWLVRAGVADVDLARVRIGDRAEIGLGRSEAVRVHGRVTQIAGAANAATRTTEVEIQLDTPPAEARSGVAVTATLLPQPVPARPRVPATVLIEGEAGGASVFVVEEGSAVARRQRVEVETLDGPYAYLRTALPQNARLVVRGGEYLRDGGRIQIATP